MTLRVAHRMQLVEFLAYCGLALVGQAVEALEHASNGLLARGRELSELIVLLLQTTALFRGELFVLIEPLLKLPVRDWAVNAPAPSAAAGATYCSRRSNSLA